MSYCSLEEAWGQKTICSRVENKKGKKGNVSYNITNENHCNENNFMYNDLEDNYSLLPNSDKLNNMVLDKNNNNTILNTNNELSINSNDPTFLNYMNIEENNIETNNVLENNIENNNIEENNIDNDVINNVVEDNDVINNVVEDNNKDKIEGFTSNNVDNIENFTTMLDDVMKRLDAIEEKLSKSNNKQNNVHDIILYIIIGVFILFALDSIFKIGRLTV